MAIFFTKKLNLWKNIFISSKVGYATNNDVTSSGFFQSIDKKQDSFSSFIKKLQQTEKEVKNEYLKKNSLKHTNDEKKLEEKSFAKLLRESHFIQWGDISSPFIATGKIVKVVENDLYIDFGGKFYCVCKNLNNDIRLVRNAKVRLRVTDFELSTRFLGSDSDMTLLEADAKIIGVTYSPVKNENKVKEDNEYSNLQENVQ